MVSQDNLWSKQVFVLLPAFIMSIPLQTDSALVTWQTISLMFFLSYFQFCQSSRKQPRHRILDWLPFGLNFFFHPLSYFSQLQIYPLRVDLFILLLVVIVSHSCRLAWGELAWGMLGIRTHFLVFLSSPQGLTHHLIIHQDHFKYPSQSTLKHRVR